MRRVLIPGSFDPFTMGHFELVKNACESYDEVLVGIFVNPEKTYLFSEKEREQLIKLACYNFPQVKVSIQNGYTADFAKEQQCTCIIRGYRNQMDLEYELNMSEYNKNRSGIPTLLIPCPKELAEVSSSRVREALKEGKPIAGLVPNSIAPFVLQLYKNKQENSLS